MDFDQTKDQNRTSKELTPKKLEELLARFLNALGAEHEAPPGQERQEALGQKSTLKAGK